jgi:hypothetical protein
MLDALAREVLKKLLTEVVHHPQLLENIKNLGSTANVASSGINS